MVCVLHLSSDHKCARRIARKLRDKYKESCDDVGHISEVDVGSFI